jgi:hypothetical protein
MSESTRRDDGALRAGRVHVHRVALRPPRAGGSGSLACSRSTSPPPPQRQPTRPRRHHRLHGPSQVELRPVDCEVVEAAEGEDEPGSSRPMGTQTKRTINSSGTSPELGVVGNLPEGMKGAEDPAVAGPARRPPPPSWARGMPGRGTGFAHLRAMVAQRERRAFAAAAAVVGWEGCPHGCSRGSAVLGCPTHARRRAGAGATPAAIRRRLQSRRVACTNEGPTATAATKRARLRPEGRRNRLLFWSVETPASSRARTPRDVGVVIAIRRPTFDPNPPRLDPVVPPRWPRSPPLLTRRRCCAVPRPSPGMAVGPSAMKPRARGSCLPWPAPPASSPPGGCGHRPRLQPSRAAARSRRRCAPRLRLPTRPASPDEEGAVAAIVSRTISGSFTSFHRVAVPAWPTIRVPRTTTRS